MDQIALHSFTAVLMTSTGYQVKLRALTFHRLTRWALDGEQQSVTLHGQAVRDFLYLKLLERTVYSIILLHYHYRLLYSTTAVYSTKK